MVPSNSADSTPSLHDQLFSFESVQRFAGFRPVRVDEITADELEADAPRISIETDSAHADFDAQLDAQLDARRALIALGDRLGRDVFELVVASAAKQLGYPVSFE